MKTQGDGIAVRMTAIGLVLALAITAHGRLPRPRGRVVGGPRTLDLGGGVTLDLVWIPPGTFTMGSPPDEHGRRQDEGPQHQVTISKGFWMGKYPVTQRQYRQIMGDNPSFTENLDAPVTQVNWSTAKAFCERLQKRALRRGEIMRLPTEAEWEYACRAGTTLAHYNTKERPVAIERVAPPDASGPPPHQDLDEIAWYLQNSGRIIQPAGRKKPNAWGLYDMLGNVYEWCEDGYRVYTSSPQTDPAQDPTEDVRELRGNITTEDIRACRGGSVYSPSEDCRSARRSSGSMHRVTSWRGFRVVVLSP